jgi:hypothetical protein
MKAYSYYPKSFQQGIRLNLPQVRFLRGEAKRLGISVSDLIRRIIDEYRDAHPNRENEEHL